MNRFQILERRITIKKMFMKGILKGKYHFSTPSKTWICGCLLARIASSNPTEGMVVYFLRVLCVVW